MSNVTTERVNSTSDNSTIEEIKILKKRQEKKVLSIPTGAFISFPASARDLGKIYPLEDTPMSRLAHINLLVALLFFFSKFYRFYTAIYSTMLYTQDPLMQSKIYITNQVTFKMMKMRKKVANTFIGQCVLSVQRSHQQPRPIQAFRPVRSPELICI